MNYLVTLQVKPTAQCDYESLGGYFKTIEVKAESQKEAWAIAQRIAKENPQLKYTGIVVAIQEVIHEQKPQVKAAAKKTWEQRLQALAGNYELIIKERDKFVCEYIVLLTQKKGQRERVDGYQLKKVGKKYQLYFNGQAMFRAADADTMYSWFVRLPLRKLQIEADNYRIDVYDKLQNN